MARKLPSLLTFVVGVAMVGVGSVCIVLRPPLGLFILPFGVVFLVLGGLTLLFHASGVKLRAHHVIENAVGLLFILFADYLVFSDSLAVPMTLVTGMVFLVLGWFPWAYKLPSYVALAIGGTLLAAACLAGVYVPLIIGRGFVDGEIVGFSIHLTNFTLGVPGIALILAGVARFFRWLLFKTSTQLENADGRGKTETFLNKVRSTLEEGAEESVVSAEPEKSKKERQKKHGTSWLLDIIELLLNLFD